MLIIIQQKREKEKEKKRGKKKKENKLKMRSKRILRVELVVKPMKMKEKRK